MSSENGKKKFCSNCGKEIDPNAAICVNCGVAIEKPTKAKKTTITENNIPEEYRPITMWGYFGYQILFALPLVGLILILVFSFGGTKNKNLRNFARSYFCVYIIALIVVVIVAICAGLFAASATRSYYY